MNEFEIRQGDNMDLLPLIPERSIDSCVTDPPYGLEFMSVAWDTFDERKGGGRVPNTWNDHGSKEHARNATQAPRIQRNKNLAFYEFSVSWAKEIYRVLKPGSHLLAFGGSRTWHRMVCAIEDAGFEIRDSIHWIYGSGFPKSLDVSKAIDKASGTERQVIGRKPAMGGVVHRPNGTGWDRPWQSAEGAIEKKLEITIGATDESRQWDGWGTAMKPSHEPIVLARKPLSEKTVAANVLKWGTGAINVAGCRIGIGERTYAGMSARQPQAGVFRDDNWIPKDIEVTAVGRWPANVIFDEHAATELDRQSGDLKAGGSLTGDEPSKVTQNCYGDYKGRHEWDSYNDEGGASRFFYVAKASTSERGDGNNHPTVKPVELMQYLCRLVTPPGGTVIDPFCGSGSTGIAALREGFRFIGLEREAEYVAIAKGRILDDAPLLNREVTA